MIFLIDPSDVSASGKCTSKDWCRIKPMYGVPVIIAPPGEK